MKWKAKSPYSLTPPASWSQLPFGDAYSTLIGANFEKWFARIAGRRLLKISGLSAEVPCYQPLQQVVLNDKTSEKLAALCRRQQAILIEGSLQELPFGEETVDACLLANTLNFTQDPHQLLRETERILSDDGYLLISLFNPCSKLLFKRRLGKFDFRLFLPFRVIDWLELLNFEILSQQTLCFGHEPKVFGSLCLIVAQKRTLPLTLQPQKVRFENQEILNPAGAFKEKINT
ncbi:class I SAM-dependent methyltransferase [Actinobacillus succinogenes]|uniref:Methyltransferase type 11 n=1 Tax=Actinobacillus succinogenes (strain ATCC 55618 / DSM 22257 / CCUG 43843 / 130Z) TaxID=339671 RepID=A6VNK3_ACTSZ|nr:methyltransferase domain-containing protein [Actinobacillus succinogenes]ABR74550.1 Methyltransferase type 11 [Actinobacillus succinogenes 130Z]PHI41029.1 class I SAM-dependent methyltransferase [Actinobacillus succinogenes]